ncbi:MAG: hypothetical protein KDD52_02815 [Bdellovibrionales bacterium]|nr:hypothetical protein [Bdellovibrionales bacterium]
MNWKTVVATNIITTILICLGFFSYGPEKTIEANNLNEKPKANSNTDLYYELSELYERVEKLEDHIQKQPGASESSVVFYGPSEKSEKLTSKLSNEPNDNTINDSQKHFDPVISNEFLEKIEMDLSSEESVSIDPNSTERQALTTLDTNQDHKVTKKELRQYKNMKKSADRFARKNNLGTGSYPISKSSFRRSDKTFAGLDLNHDQVIDEEEYMEMSRRARQELSKYDIDRSSYLDSEELGQGQVRFDYLDQDQDGRLYLYEILEALIRSRW